MREQKSFPNLPKELTSKCRALIKNHVRKRRSVLAADIWHTDIIAFIAAHSDLFEIWSLAVYWFKLRRILWIASAIIAASGYFSLYILLGLLPAFAIERFFARQMEAMYLLLASIILALEMLAADFAGVGEMYPQARDEAVSAFSRFAYDARTVLLDRYLPNRSETSPEPLRAFALHTE